MLYKQCGNQQKRILSLPVCVDVTLLIMPQKPVCLFWSSPRWYICLRVIAILNTESKSYRTNIHFSTKMNPFQKCTASFCWQSCPSSGGAVSPMQECHCLWHSCTKSKCTELHIRGSRHQATGKRQTINNKVLYMQNWIEPTVQITWGNRTCMCMDSWQHRTQTTKPWVWPQSHQHGWSAALWRGCLSKEATQDWKQPLLFMSLLPSLSIKGFIFYWKWEFKKRILVYRERKCVHYYHV